MLVVMQQGATEEQVQHVIDRLVYGHVIDFLDFHVGNWHWPAFNLADSAIVVGAGLLVIELLFSKTPKDDAPP